MRDRLTNAGATKVVTSLLEMKREVVPLLHLAKPVTPSQMGAALRRVGRKWRSVGIVEDHPDMADLLAEMKGSPEMELTGFTVSDLAAFKMEPAGDVPPKPEPARVEVTLVTDPETYTRLAPRLDGLVGEFDLVVSVRRTE